MTWQRVDTAKAMTQALVDEAGGDYFDYLPMLNGSLGIVVGDAAGHGMGPALIMAETRAYLRIVALNRQRPAEALCLLW